MPQIKFWKYKIENLYLQITLQLFYSKLYVNKMSRKGGVGFEVGGGVAIGVCGVVY